MTLNRKLALIDLSRKTVDLQPIPRQWQRDYLGGRGLANYLLVQHAPSGCDPLGSENVVIVSAGPAAGTPLAPIAATYLTTHSTLTDGLACAGVDGLVASQMRWAGFDHLVIKGQAADPVWLDVCDGNIAIRDARKLWGAGIRGTRAGLYSAAGDGNLQSLVVGPAAENRVRFATVAASRGSCAGRTGVGAVLGSKKVKAVALRGGLDIAVKHPQGLLQQSRALLAAALKSNARRAAAADDLMSIFELSPSQFRGRRMLTAAGRTEHALDQGLDVLTTEGVIEWIDRLLDRGVVTPEAVGGTVTSPAEIEALMRRIVYRENIGDVLAEGPERAAETLGFDCLQFFKPMSRLLKSCTEDKLNPLGYLDPAVTDPHRISTENVRRERVEPKTRTGYSGAFGNIGRAELHRMIWDCVGVCPSAIPGDGDRLDHISRLMRHLSGAVFAPAELEEIAYRSAAIERLWNRNPTSTGRGSRLPVDSWGEVRLSDAQWARMDLDDYRCRLETARAESGWNRTSMENRKNWTRAGIDELWPLQ